MFELSGPNLYPPPETGVPHRKDMESVEILWDGDGVLPERTWDQWMYYGMEILWDGDGIPPLEQTHACENTTFHHTMYTGGNR